jgi:hypothetical protein
MTANLASINEQMAYSRKTPTLCEREARELSGTNLKDILFTPKNRQNEMQPN